MEEKLRKFNRSKSETIERIGKEVRGGGGGEFVVPPTPRPVMELVIKYVAMDDLRTDILSDDSKMELFKVWSHAMINLFGEVYFNKRTNSQLFHAFLNRVDRILKDRILSNLDKEGSPQLNQDVIPNELKVTNPLFMRHFH